MKNYTHKILNLASFQNQYNGFYAKFIESFIKFENCKSTKINDFHFMVSNEEFSPEILKLFQSKDSHELKSSSCRVGILTGESHLLSFIPVLHQFCDVVILNDVDHAVTIYLKGLLEIFEKSNSPEEFKTSYLSQNGLFPEEFIKNECTRYNLDNKNNAERAVKAFLLNESKDYLEEHHFLSSNAQFNKCKEASKKILFVHSNINYFKQSQVQDLAHTLRKFDATVTLLNVSNIPSFDSDKRIQKPLLSLPFSDNPLIVYSKKSFFPTFCLKMHHCNNLLDAWEK